MTLKLCPQCKRPFMASEKFFPRCPRAEWDQESLANLGCLLATILPLIIMLLFWLFLIFGIFYDIPNFFE